MPSHLTDEQELRAWASVGRHGVCVHSRRVEGCAGCKIWNAVRALRAIEQLEDGPGAYAIAQQALHTNGWS